MKHVWSLVIFSACLTLSSARRTDHGDIPKPDKEKFLANQKAIEEDKYFWAAVAEQELQETLSVQLNMNVAKNVIIFLGDGMGLPTITSSRIYAGQLKNESGEEGYLSFEKFPHAGLVKTYNVDFTVPDSAGTGTAYLCGVKTNKGVVGFDSRVGRGLCETITADSVIYSIAKWSQDKGKRTGVVTSTRITHATPSAIYAHTPERDFECDATLEGTCLDFKDIARQLVEDEPGNKLNVIMGGGFSTMDNDTIDYPADPANDPWGCTRQDGRKLWQTWLNDRQSEGKVASFVRNKTDLDAVDLNSTEFLMGIFANGHIPYEYQKRELGLDLPTLRQMTEAAIQVLSQEPNGFFLLVEGGRIDLSHHDSQAKVAMDETVAFSDAIERALEMTSEEDTLIVVTADHSHTMTINGYPERGTPITGLGGDDEFRIPYTTLTYANGKGYNYNVVAGQVVRGNPSQEDTSSFDYVQQSTAFLFTETHGGEDVAVYARGPMSHLFTSVHEQNYIARAMAYASCVDSSESHCATKRSHL